MLKLPPNVEELVMNGLSNFHVDYSQQLKRVIANCHSLVLPEKHYELIEFNGNEISNIFSISCDILIYNGSVQFNWNKDLMMKFEKETEKTISISTFADLSNLSMKRITLKPEIVQKVQRVQMNFFSVNPYQSFENKAKKLKRRYVVLPKELEYLKLEENISIVNLNEIKIDLLEITDEKGMVIQTIRNWNKENEETQSVREINLTVWKNIDLSRFTNLKKVILQGNGIVKLPQQIETLQMNNKIHIENANESTITNLIVCHDNNIIEEWDDIFKEFQKQVIMDLSMMKVINKIEINSKTPCRFEVKLPSENHHIQISEDIDIINLNEITIDLFEIVNKNGNGNEIQRNWNKESEFELRQIEKIIKELKSNYYDFSRFIYTKEFNLTAKDYEKQVIIKLPQLIEKLQISSNIIIENVKDITIDNLLVSKSYYGSNSMDLSDYKLTNHLVIENPGNDEFEIKSPSVKNVSCFGKVKITNKKQVKIGKISKDKHPSAFGLYGGYSVDFMFWSSNFQ